MEIVTMINEYKRICKNSCYNRDNYEKQQASISSNNGNSLNE